MSYATMYVRKMDNGYNGVILNTSERGLFKRGDAIFNRQFHPFPTGSLLRVVVRFSKVGRRMVQSVTLEREAEVEVMTMLRTEEEGMSATTKAGKQKSVPVAKVEEVKSSPVPKAQPLDNGYYIDPEIRLNFNAAYRLSRSQPERAVKAMMVGPSGYGKTTLPRLFAQAVGMRFYRMNCATVRDPEEWFGFREAKEGSTVFIKSQFAKLIEEGNLVVVLDEFNRLEPWLHNTLFPLLDDDGCTVVHDQEFRIGPNVIVVGTVNTGYEYTGVFELDEALLNRFQFVMEVRSMPHDEEVRVLQERTRVTAEVAERIVKTCNVLRSLKVVCSTRTSLLIAMMTVAGMTIREGFESAVVMRIQDNSSGGSLRKQVVDAINVECGVLRSRELEQDVFKVGAIADEASAENKPVEQEQVRVYELRLRKSATYVNQVGTIKLLRSFMLLDAHSDAYRMGIAEAQRLTETISAGKEEVVLSLAKKPDNWDEIAKNFQQMGVGGQFKSYLV